MELDDFKRAWAMLERNLAINEHLVRDHTLGKVRSTLVPLVAWRAAEVVLGIVTLLLCGPVIATHLGEPRYVLIGGSLLVFVGGLTASCAYLLVQSARLDYSGAIVELQRSVAQMRSIEYRGAMWALLGGVVMWLPLALVIFEALTGVHALGLADLAWLLGNLGFGVAVLVVGRALSRRYVERADLGPRARRFVDAMTGHSLRRISRHVDELVRFTRDP
jgi:hypothetical protein